MEIDHSLVDWELEYGTGTVFMSDLPVEVQELVLKRKPFRINFPTDTLSFNYVKKSKDFDGAMMWTYSTLNYMPGDMAPIKLEIYE